MFDLGWSEIMVIIVVALIFINPKDLPKFLYQIGKIYGQLQRAYQDMMRQVRVIEAEGRRQVEEAMRPEGTESSDAASPYGVNAEPEKTPSPAAPSKAKKAVKTGATKERKTASPRRKVAPRPPARKKKGR